MTLVLATHEVEDVAKWVSSPVRQSVFGSKDIKVTTFTDPNGSNITGLLFDVPDMDEFQSIMQSDDAKKAAEGDGVKFDTLQVLKQTQKFLLRVILGGYVSAFITGMLGVQKQMDGILTPYAEFFSSCRR